MKFRKIQTTIVLIFQFFFSSLTSFFHFFHFYTLLSMLEWCVRFVQNNKRRWKNLLFLVSSHFINNATSIFIEWNSLSKRRREVNSSLQNNDNNVRLYKLAGIILFFLHAASLSFRYHIFSWFFMDSIFSYFFYLSSQNLINRFFSPLLFLTRFTLLFFPISVEIV